MGFNRAEGVDRFTFLNITVLPKLAEDVLDNSRLVLSRGFVKDVKVDAEPVVDSNVLGVVLCAKARGIGAFFDGFGFGGGTVLILCMVKIRD